MKKHFQREYVRTIISEGFVFVVECSTNISDSSSGNGSVLNGRRV
jgi:hypothetical protein